MKEYMNTSLAPRKRAELLLKEMNLDEKMAQLVGVFAIKGAEDRMMAFFKHGIGQISSLESRCVYRRGRHRRAAWQAEPLRQDAPVHRPVRGPNPRLLQSSQRLHVDPGSQHRLHRLRGLPAPSPLLLRPRSELHQF